MRSPDEDCQPIDRQSDRSGELPAAVREIPWSIRTVRVEQVPRRITWQGVRRYEVSWPTPSRLAWSRSLRAISRCRRRAGGVPAQLAHQPSQTVAAQLGRPAAPSRDCQPGVGSSAVRVSPGCPWRSGLALRGHCGTKVIVRAAMVVSAGPILSSGMSPLAIDTVSVALPLESTSSRLSGLASTKA